MQILNFLVFRYEHNKSLVGKTVLVCTHATAVTLQLVIAITRVGANVVYVPIQYNKNESVFDNF